ncbi:MAG: hypothetical protein AB8B72_06640 [Crocinitomicaceae bacterium]
MTQFKKYFILIYLSIFIASAAAVANLFILPASDSLYSYVPVESDIVIEVNAFNFVNEVGYQWIYEPEHFISDSDIKEDDMPTMLGETGVNPFSKILLFKEKWANESLWFVVVQVNNKDNFRKYIEGALPKTKILFEKNIALLQLTVSNNQVEVWKHLKNIAAHKVKSILNHPIVKTDFSDQNEINVYLKSLKSDYITDGYLNINFESSEIDIDGYFHPIGSTDLQAIAYKPENNIGLSLRSSLNLLHSIYLFTDTKIGNLPDYKQIALDYDGVNLLTNNDVIPVTSFPNINLMLDVYDEKTWLKYLDSEVDEGNLLVFDDTVMINSEVKAKVRYNIGDNRFKLFQSEKIFEKHSDSIKTYFELYIHPQQIIEKMVFREDLSNPPKLVASQIIKIIKTLLDDFSYLKEIEEVKFSISKDSNKSDFLSKGHIVFKNPDSHSTIECYFLLQRFIKSFGNLVH